jgi:AraC-like DNA-binding protein
LTSIETATGPAAFAASGLTHIDPGLIQGGQHFDVWRACTASLYDLAPVGSRLEYRAGGTAYSMGEVVFTHVRFDETVFHRTGHHLGVGDSERVTLQYYQSGALRGVFDDGAPMRSGPDAVSFRDQRRTYSAVGTTGDLYAVVIPLRLLCNDTSIFATSPMVHWPVDTPRGRLVIDTLLSIHQQLKHADVVEARNLAAGFVGLISGLLQTDGGTELPADHDAAVLPAIKAHIDANVAACPVDIDDLCIRFGCSRATLYRRFLPLGGVQTYITNQRLDRAFQELTATERDTKLRVRSVAERWGFFDPKSFNRAFHRRFGVNPSDVFSAGTKAGSSPVLPMDYAEAARRFNLAFSTS